MPGDGGATSAVRRDQRTLLIDAAPPPSAADLLSCGKAGGGKVSCWLPEMHGWRRAIGRPRRRRPSDSTPLATVWVLRPVPDAARRR